MGIRLSQLKQSGASTDDVATWNGTEWVPAAPPGGGALPADAAGWLHDDGSGTLTWTTPTAADVGAQASDADLTAIAGLDSSTSGAIASDGSGWIKKTYAQLKTALSLVKGDVGLGNVDNTADTAKPVSTATQTALNLKANLAAPALTGAATLDASAILTAASALVVTSNNITADVTMTTAGTYYDGPSLTPAAGTYLLYGHVTCLAVTNAARTIQGKLWDGTTVLANDVFNVPGTAAAGQGPMTFLGKVTTDGTKTYKVSCTSTVNGDKIVHNAQKGSYLFAVKIP